MSNTSAYLRKTQTYLNERRAHTDAVAQVHLRLMGAIRDSDPIAEQILTLGAVSYGTSWTAPYNADRDTLLDWLAAASNVFAWLARLPEFTVEQPVKPGKASYGSGEMVSSHLRYHAARYRTDTTVSLEAQYTPSDECRVVPTGETITKTIQVTKTECVPGTETGAAWDALGVPQPAVLDEELLKDLERAIAVNDSETERQDADNWTVAS